MDVTLNGEAVKSRDLDDITVSAGDSVSIVEADHEDRFGFGVGIGLVNLDEEAIEDDVETYLTAHLRIAFGDTSAHKGGRRGLRGYLEPEIGIWESDFASDSCSASTSSARSRSTPWTSSSSRSLDPHAGVDAIVLRNGEVRPATDDDAFGVNA